MIQIPAWKRTLATVVAVCGLLGACQTTQWPSIFREDGDWTTIPRAESHIQFEGTPKTKVIFTERQDNTGVWRHERAFLLTDAYGGYRSRVRVLMSNVPDTVSDRNSTAWLRDPAELFNLAATSRCVGAELSSVKTASNRNGPFIYLTCEYPRTTYCVECLQKHGDVCVLATQKIDERSGGESGTSKIALVEWLLCSSNRDEAEKLAKFGSLRLR